MARTRVKICCIADHSEAALAAEAGADAIGLVGPMPTGPGAISLYEAKTIARSVLPPVSRFLLSSEESAAGLISAAGQTGVDVLQIVRHVSPAFHVELAEALPYVRRVQVIHVENENALHLIEAYAPHAHAFLLDSGKPAANELGGTGRAHDWDISAEFVRRSPLPVFLAGGLDAGNAAEAIRTVRPYGLDICSGVRTEGRLDVDKLTAFMAEVRNAERSPE